jgi:hypothetical protein
MPTLPDGEAEARRLIAEAEKHGFPLRLFGGIAIKFHSPSATHRALKRDYPDIDFVTTRAGERKLAAFMDAQGYDANKTFNTLSEGRQLYYARDCERQIDIFVESFHMCHKLPLGERLLHDSLTLPLAELFLSKAQIVEMNEKDLRDLVALLLDHPVGDGDQETINAARVAELCAKDWGLHKTITLSLGKIADYLARVELPPEQHDLIFARLDQLRTRMDAEPKPLAWKMRDRVGEKVRWYELPEEVRRG